MTKSHDADLDGQPVTIMTIDPRDVAHHVRSAACRTPDPLGTPSDRRGGSGRVELDLVIETKHREQRVGDGGVEV